MNRLSESRISHLAHLVMDGLRKANLGDFPNEGRALTQTKQVLHGFFQREDQIDDIVRQKIDSLSRRVPPGAAGRSACAPQATAARPAGQPRVGYLVPEIFRGRGAQAAPLIRSRKARDKTNFHGKSLDIIHLMLRFVLLQTTAFLAPT